MIPAIITLVTGMVVICSLEAAVEYLSNDGHRDVEVVVSCDTRSKDAVFYSAGFSELRAAWAKYSRHRVYVDLIGNPPLSLQHHSEYWLKVAVVKRLIACRRVLYLLWLDSDAIIRPILPATKAHGKQDEAFSFLSLADIFEKFAMAPSTAFLGYKEPSDSASGWGGFNSGAFLVRGGCTATLALLNDWIALHPKDSWKPGATNWQVAPGSEQYEFNRSFAKRPCVTLCTEEEYCDRGSRLKSESPLVHFYGHTQFHGKSAIPKWCLDAVSRMSLSQRRRVPLFCALAHRSKSGVAVAKRKARARSSAAARRACGKRVGFQGKMYMSIRAASDATGINRKVIRQSMK